MKKAVIVVGAHHVGKSVTINKHLKPLLGISYDAHRFELNGSWGFIWSQSPEESGRGIIARIIIKISIEYEMFVVACRPRSEPGSMFGQLHDFFANHSFDVKTLEIQNPEQAKETAAAAFEFLNSNQDTNRARPTVTLDGVTQRVSEYTLLSLG